MTLKTTKIKVSFDRTFALANYENIRPRYEVEQEFTINEWKTKEQADSDIALRIKDLRKIILSQIKEDANLFKLKIKK